MKSKPAHYVDTPYRPWPPLSRQTQSNFYFRPPDPMDLRNFKTASSKGSTYSDFSGMSAYSNKSRDYYFLSPSYRSAGAPTPSGHTELYARERPRQLRNPNPSPTSPSAACPCSRSRSLEDVRTEIVTEWEDDDENGNRIVAPATKFNRTSYKTNSSIQKQGYLTRHSMENLVDRAPQLLPPKRISAFQVIELTFYRDGRLVEMTVIKQFDCMILHKIPERRHVLKQCANNLTVLYAFMQTFYRLYAMRNEYLVFMRCLSELLEMCYVGIGMHEDRPSVGTSPDSLSSFSSVEPQHAVRDVCNGRLLYPFLLNIYLTINNLPSYMKNN